MGKRWKDEIEKEMWVSIGFLGILQILFWEFIKSWRFKIFVESLDEGRTPWAAYHVALSRVNKVRKSPMERLRKKEWHRRGLQGKFLYKFYYEIWMYGFKIAFWHQFLSDITYLKQYGKPPTRGIVYWSTIWFMPGNVKAEIFRLRESFYGNKYLNIRGFSKRYTSDGLEY